MKMGSTNNRWLIALSFLLVMPLMVYPLAVELRWYRPELMALLVIYWTIAYPEDLGVGMAWLAGLTQDILQGGLLGNHALAFVVLAHVCQLSYQRIRTYSLFQQSVWVFVLVGIHQLFSNWINSLAGRSEGSLVFLLPALISALLWPLISLWLEHWRITYRVQ